MLGDMLELGDISAEEHYNIGRYAATAGVDVLAAVGSFSEDMRRGAEASGMKRSNIYTFSTTEEAIASLNDIVASGDVVLLKGSRRMRMEDIVDFLRERG
jgi:UDP-N-acetylmuramoyl-tripeptide--D-alanyl-D-alanine ligase